MARQWNIIVDINIIVRFLVVLKHDGSLDGFNTVCVHLYCTFLPKWKSANKYSVVSGHAVWEQTSY